MDGLLLNSREVGRVVVKEWPVEGATAVAHWTSHSMLKHQLNTDN